MKHELVTTYRAWDDLKPHPRNPRNGDVDAIVESLRVNGQYRPLVTTKDGTILSGNHTYMAAGELRWNHVACVTLDIDPMSPQAHRIMLADNRTADLGKYDDGVLMELLHDLVDTDFGLVGTGYSSDDVITLVDSVTDPFIPAVDGPVEPLRHEITCPGCGLVWEQ